MEKLKRKSVQKNSLLRLFVKKTTVDIWGNQIFKRKLEGEDKFLENDSLKLF